MKVTSLDDLPPSFSKVVADDIIEIPTGITMDEAEKIIIMENLARNKGNKTKTADVLGIGRKTLHRKLDEWGEAEKSTSNVEKETVL